MSVFPESSGKRALPKSTRRYAFSLTPLADAMLQLLIFFMLSSSMAAYSLLGLNSAAAPALGAGPALPAMVTGGEAPRHGRLDGRGGRRGGQWAALRL